jgi:hypothetical protein
MALDTTVGGASADSYITDAEYQAYWLDRGVVLSAVTTNEADLRKAADWLDRSYNFAGYKATGTQRRAWPRVTTILVDGYTVSSTVIPQDIKDAQAELANLIRGGLNPAATIDGTLASESVRAGPVASTKTYQGGKSSPRLVAIEGLLAPYTGGGSAGQVRLQRG